MIADAREPSYPLQESPNRRLVAPRSLPAPHVRRAFSLCDETWCLRWCRAKPRELVLSVVASAGVADKEVPDESEPADQRRRRLERAFRRGQRRGGDEGSGGLGVREPRRPMPGGEADGAEVEPEDSGQ
jgi:hypothetical protein